MPHFAPTVLIVGDGGRPEFRAALGDARAQATKWTVAADVEAAAAVIESGEFVPEVIVLAQAYPGQIGHAAVDRLRRLLPLARLVGLLGTWCEGETRTGRPWPGVSRFAWHQWPWRGPRQLAALAAGEPTPLLLPPTATAEEAVLAETQPGPPLEGRVAIYSRNRTMADMLTAACRAWGLQAIAACDTAAGGTRAALFDCDELHAAAIDELTAFARAAATAHVAVLASFPRLDDVLRALEVGAVAVFSKPVDLNDVRAWLDTAGATA